MYATTLQERLLAVLCRELGIHHKELGLWGAANRGWAEQVPAECTDPGALD